MRLFPWPRSVVAVKRSVVNLMARPVLGLEQALRTERTLRHAAWAASSFSLVLLLVALAILVLGAGAGAASAPGGPDVGQVALLAGFQLVMATLGALIVRRHTRNPIGWIFIVVALLFGVAGAAGSYGSFAVASLPGAGIAAWAATIASGPVLFGALVFLFLLFPSGRLPSSRWRWAARVTTAALLLVTLSEATLPGPLQSYPSVSNPFGIEPLGPILQAVFAGASLLLLLMVTVAAVSLIARFRRSQGTEREQLKWVASATAVVAILFLSTGIPKWRDVISAATIPPRGGADVETEPVSDRADARGAGRPGAPSTAPWSTASSRSASSASTC